MYYSKGGYIGFFKATTCKNLSICVLKIQLGEGGLSAFNKTYPRHRPTHSSRTPPPTSRPKKYGCPAQYQLSLLLFERFLAKKSVLPRQKNSQRGGVARLKEQSGGSHTPLHISRAILEWWNPNTSHTPPAIPTPAHAP